MRWPAVSACCAPQRLSGVQCPAAARQRSAPQQSGAALQRAPTLTLGPAPAGLRFMPDAEVDALVAEIDAEKAAAEAARRGPAAGT